MPSKIAEKVPGWVARFLLPEIQRVVEKEVEHLRNEMNTRFKSIDDRFKSLDERMIGLRNEMKAGFEAVNTRLDEMEKRFDLIRDVTLLKAEVKELREKITIKA